MAMKRGRPLTSFAGDRPGTRIVNEVAQFSGIFVPVLLSALRYPERASRMKLRGFPPLFPAKVGAPW
jgi:hypothetical protein